MRTTVTLDPDTDAVVRKLMRECTLLLIHAPATEVFGQNEMRVQNSPGPWRLVVLAAMQSDLTPNAQRFAN